TSSCGSLRWAEHMCMKMTPSGIAGTECLGHDPGMGASLDDICGLVALTNLLICGDHDSWVELPHKIFALTKLEVLELQLMNVETLPAKMPEVFIQLQELHLRCEGLEYLPTSFTCPWAFPALLELEISSDVVEFPEVAKGAFPKLRTLDLSFCEALESFPEVPKGAFPKLRTLDLSYCKSLGSLPLSLEVLATLRKLILKGFSLPASFFRSFPKLRVLDLSGGKFRNLPEELGDLEDLVCLDLSSCNNLEILPDAVMKLHVLKCLNLPECRRLKYLPSGLKVLELGLENVETLPAEMPYWFIQLQELHLWDFESLEYLPRSFTCCGAFAPLINLQISYFSSLVEFPEVDEGALPKLRTLEFDSCDSLGNLPLSLEVLTSLRKLILLDCEETLKTLVGQIVK
ncbi:unnamed protein product, partial [Sphagnum balticum]